MERTSKLCKILSQSDFLIEEKKCLEENLVLIFNKIQLYVEYAKKNENGNPKIHNEILIYELKILEKLTGFNLDLERFLEGKSVGISEILEKNFDCIKIPTENETESCNETFELTKVKSEVDIPAQHLGPSVVESSISNACLIDIDQSSTITPFEFSEFEYENEGPESDIQNLRNCLNNVSAGLGLNEESFLNMKSFYEKPLTSYKKEDKIDLCQRIIPEETPVSNTSKKTTLVRFELPVRDTNKPGLLLSNTENSNCPKSNNSLDVITKKEQENQILSETDFILRNDCKHKTPDLKFSGKIRNQKRCSFGVSNNDSTALKKLNNYQSKKSSDDSLELPDISLKPTKTNYFSGSKSVTSENTSQMKTQKKRGKSENATFKSSKLECPENTDMSVPVNEPKHKVTPKVGDECAFSHIESPSEFYIHIADKETALIDSINEQSSEYFNGTESPYCSKRAAVGDIGKFCFSYIPDYDGWFRVMIIDWYLNNDLENVLVQLADYGNKRITSYKNLRKMIKEISDIPLLAIQCHFPQMFPFGSIAGNKVTDWPEVAVEAMVGLSKTSHLFKVMYAEKKLQSVAIDLSTMEEGRDTLGQILLDMGIAVQVFDEH